MCMNVFNRNADIENFDEVEEYIRRDRSKKIPRTDKKKNKKNKLLTIYEIPQEIK